jgi:hypothetical protein
MTFSVEELSRDLLETSLPAGHIVEVQVIIRFDILLNLFQMGATLEYALDGLGTETDQQHGENGGAVVILRQPRKRGGARGTMPTRMWRAYLSEQEEESCKREL